MDLIYMILKDETILKDKKKAHLLRFKSARYVIYSDKPYRRGISLPFLKCMDEEEEYYILRYIHEGI